MIEYKNVLLSLGLNDIVSQCAIGDIPCPISSCEAPPYWYGFPPALIPIWSRSIGPKYFGLWKHWFVDREPTFVEMYVASGRITYEVARSLEQFFCYITILAIVDQDEITHEIEQFSKNVGLKHLDKINLITLKSGDNPIGFLNLDNFKNKTPLNCIRNNDIYTGDFPVKLSNGSWRNIEKASEFEVDSNALQNICNIGDFPLWLSRKEAPRLSLFRECLSEKKPADAWFVLNSKGWSIADARSAIIELADFAKDSQFDLLVSAWLSVADHTSGGY